MHHNFALHALRDGKQPVRGLIPLTKASDAETLSIHDVIIRVLDFFLQMSRPSLLEILAERPIVGDGSYVWTLEKRGYVRAGPYTPECIVEHPYAGTIHVNMLKCARTWQKSVWWLYREDSVAALAHHGRFMRIWQTGENKMIFEHYNMWTSVSKTNCHLGQG